MQKQIVLRIILSIFVALLLASSLGTAPVLADASTPGAENPYDSIPPAESQESDPDETSMGLIETIIIIILQIP